MKKLFLLLTFLFFTFTLFAEDGQTETKEVYTKDFMTKFATALYMEKENPQEALKLYEELFAQAPGDITLLKILATLCARIDSKTCAQKYIPLYLQAAPQDYDALALSGLLAWQKGNLKEAQEYYSAALKKDEQTPQVLMQYLTLLNTVDKDQAINFLKELEENNNLLYKPVNLEIAQIYLNQNQPEKAILSLDNAIKKHPQTRDFYLAKIKIYESRKDISALLKVYETMEKEGILEEEELIKIGAYLILQNKEKEAKNYYLRAYEQNPGNARACEFLSLWEQKQKNYLQAEEYLRRSELFKTDPGLRLKQVYLLKLAGAQDKALLAMRQAYQDFSQSLEIAFYYALILEDNKDYKQAAALLEKLLQKQPDNEEFLLNYAYTLNELKNHKKMQQVLQKVIDKNPKNAEALNFLGYYLVDSTKQIEQGGTYIKQALEIAPKNSAAIDSLAWYFYKTGKYREALNLLETLPDKDKKDQEIIWHFAKVYESLGDKEKALKYYQSLLNSDGYSSQAKKAIKKISKK